MNDEKQAKTDTGVASFCKNHAGPYIPGFLTPTEAMAALASGAELLKLFPGSLPGPNYIKALHGPFPHAKIMPTGGVSLDNVWDWIKNGAAAIGTGSNLTAPAKQGNYEEVTRLASEYVRLVKEARKAK